MICTIWDEYMQSKWEGHAFWGVTLNDGTVVYDDTGRVHNAWLNLKEHCLQNKLFIDRMYLRFRSHYEHIPQGKGYTFIKSVLAPLNSESNFHYYNVGILNEKFSVQKFRVPELILESTEERDIKSYLNLLIPGSYE